MKHLLKALFERYDTTTTTGRPVGAPSILRRSKLLQCGTHADQREIDHQSEVNPLSEKKEMYPSPR